MLKCFSPLSVGSTRNTTQLPSAAAPQLAMGLLSGLNGRAPAALAASRRFAAQVPKTVEPTQVSKDTHTHTGTVDGCVLCGFTSAVRPTKHFLVDGCSWGVRIWRWDSRIDNKDWI